MSLREKTLKNKQDERAGASSQDRETGRCEAPPPPESVHRTERGDPARESRGARRGSAGLGRGLQKNQGRDHVRQLSSLFQAPLSGDFEGLSVEGAGRFLSGRLLPLVRVLCRGPSLLRASPPAVCEAQGRSSPRAGSGWRRGDGERQKRRGVAGLSAFARCGQAARPTHRPKRGGRSPRAPLPCSPCPLRACPRPHLPLTRTTAHTEGPFDLGHLA